MSKPHVPHISVDNFEVAGGGYLPLNSPRTLEAALRIGVDLDELYPRSLSYFLSRADGKKESIAKVLAEHYESRRKDYVDEVRSERKRIVAEESRARAAAAKLMGETGAAPMAEGGSAADATRELILAQGRARVEAERKRMEFAKEKAAKEMEDRLAGERALAAKAQKDREAQDEKARVELEAKKERARRAKKEAEAKRQKEEDKLREAEARDAETRKLQAEEFEKEKIAREKAAVAAKALLIKRKADEDAARIEAMEADRAREEEAEARAEALKVRRFVTGSVDFLSLAHAPTLPSC